MSKTAVYKRRNRHSILSLWRFISQSVNPKSNPSFYTYFFLSMAIHLLVAGFDFFVDGAYLSEDTFPE